VSPSYPVEAEAGDGAQLIGRQGLGRRDVEGRRPLVVEQAGEHRQLVAEGLAGGRSGGQHDVGAAGGERGGRSLMRPRPLDALPGQRLDQGG
jgi:hypothetical protein